jgi:hypothetical protein
MTAQPQHHKKNVMDALECIHQFDFINARQLTFWLYAKTGNRELVAAHRLIRELIAQELVLRRQGGDIFWYVLALKGAQLIDVKHGRDISVLNARRNEGLVDFLTVKYHQGFNVFGPGRIRSIYPKKSVQRLADGFVLDDEENTYAVINVRNDYPQTIKRKNALKEAQFKVRGLGTDALLKELKLTRAPIND